MSAPSTPLKMQRQQGSLSSAMFTTPVSGSTFHVSSSPTTRHLQSPKYVSSFPLPSFIMCSTWPTPAKNEMFKNRKDRNVVKMTYSEVDSSLCNVDAPLSSSPATCESISTVGEQDEK